MTSAEKVKNPEPFDFVLPQSLVANDVHNLPPEYFSEFYVKILTMRSPY